MASVEGRGIGSAWAASSERAPRHAKTSGSTARLAPRAAASRTRSLARSRLVSRRGPEAICTTAARNRSMTPGHATTQCLSQTSGCSKEPLTRRALLGYVPLHLVPRPMITSRTRLVLALAAALLAMSVGAPGSSHAQSRVLCQRKNGTLFVRVGFCAKKETQVDVGDLGLVGPPGQDGQDGQDGADGAPGADG